MDIIRVLRGASLVAEKMAIRHGPEVLKKIERVAFHAMELAEAIQGFSTEPMQKKDKGNAECNSTKSPPPPTSSPPQSPPPSPTQSPPSPTQQPMYYTPQPLAPTYHIDDVPVSTPKSDSPVASQYSKSTSSNSSSVLPTMDAKNVSSNYKLTEPYAEEHNQELSHNDTVISPPATKPNQDLIGFSKVDESESRIAFSPDKDPSYVGTVMRERSVPSTQLSRMWGFGSLAVRMAGAAAANNVSRIVSGGDASASGISEENAERLAETLCRMRGAALKLGQMLSIQDDAVLPPALRRALERVRRNADYMPRRQLESQLTSELGVDWKKLFSEFQEVPIAAASIGQVHRARLLDGSDVVLKIQYPGVGESIESDLNNLKRLVTMTNLLPSGLFVDQIIKVARDELSEECDYNTEMKSQIRYRALVQADDVLRKVAFVPQVYPELCTNRILTSDYVRGVPIDTTTQLPQTYRNAIARTVLYQTIRELFSWRFMQTDPNYANFLYDHDARSINLIDFGAARSYSKTFVDGYMELVWAAANRDEHTVVEQSKRLGFLTGDESPEMIQAHVDAGMVVGEPFLKDGPFNFDDSNMTKRISQYGSVFMKYRLTPPPTEAYSLHRKLAGAFLLCIKLKANIPCRDLLADVYRSYPFDDNIKFSVS